MFGIGSDGEDGAGIGDDDICDRRISVIECDHLLIAQHDTIVDPHHRAACGGSGIGSDRGSSAEGMEL